LVDRLVRAPILRAVVDSRAPVAVRDWILEQTTTTTTTTTTNTVNDDNNSYVNYKKWDYDRVITSHFASPIKATPMDVRAAFDYLFEDTLSSSTSLPPIACKDWELLDSINQFIAKYNAGEPVVFDYQRGCVPE
jgi:phage-related tail fiber protein